MYFGADPSPLDTVCTMIDHSRLYTCQERKPRRLSCLQILETFLQGKRRTAAAFCQAGQNPEDIASKMLFLGCCLGTNRQDTGCTQHCRQS